jgi:hypothetical protein
MKKKECEQAIATAVIAAVMAERERCLDIVRTEREPGEAGLSADLLAVMANASPIIVMRAAIRTCKRSIETQIRCASCAEETETS